MSPDISVIIASYNVEAYIGRAICSALDQEGVEVEVVLVDDCSTDATLEAARSIIDPRVTCIRLAANAGPGGARNAGIAAATAPWLAVLDGDDAFLPGRLARLFKRANEMRADIVVDNLLVTRESDGARFTMFASDVFSRHTLLGLMEFIEGNRSFLGGYTLGYLKPMFSREFLRSNALNYDPELRIGEDYLLLAEALASGAACAMEQSSGYLYTVRTGSISHRLSLADVIRIMQSDKKFLVRHTLNPAAAKAQKRREHSLKEAYAFTRLIDGLKSGRVAAVLAAAAECPSCVRHLWRPLCARLNRVKKQAS